MKSSILSLLVLLFAFAGQAYSQEKVTLSGTITNKSNTETLIGVSIYIPQAKVGITTNSYGFYTTTVPKGTYTIIISHVGFDNIEETITLTENAKRNFAMTESSKTLGEVVVKSNAPKENIRKPEMRQLKDMQVGYTTHQIPSKMLCNSNAGVCLPCNHRIRLAYHGSHK